MAPFDRTTTISRGQATQAPPSTDFDDDFNLLPSHERHNVRFQQPVEHTATATKRVSLNLAGGKCWDNPEGINPDLGSPTGTKQG